MSNHDLSDARRYLAHIRFRLWFSKTGTRFPQALLDYSVGSNWLLTFPSRRLASACSKIRLLRTRNSANKPDGTILKSKMITAVYLVSSKPSLVVMDWIVRRTVRLS